jgi:hypothetical protein
MLIHRLRCRITAATKQAFAKIAAEVRNRIYRPELLARVRQIAGS